MLGVEIAQRAKELIGMLTGFKADSVTGIRRNGQSWQVTVEMVEMKRVPNAGDVLGTYEAMFDDKGNLLTYNRTRRYLRGQLQEMQ